MDFHLAVAFLAVTSSEAEQNVLFVLPSWWDFLIVCISYQTRAVRIPERTLGLCISYQPQRFQLDSKYIFIYKPVPNRTDGTRVYGHCSPVYLRVDFEVEVVPKFRHCVSFHQVFFWGFFFFFVANTLHWSSSGETFAYRLTGSLRFMLICLEDEVFARSSPAAVLVNRLRSVPPQLPSLTRYHSEQQRGEWGGAFSVVCVCVD